MIEFRDVHKSFGNLEVLKGINLNIEKGQVVTLIGPSGSGKSTILRCINLLEKPTKGQVFIDGTDITVPKADIQAVRKNIGMVFQHFNLFPHLTVKENITLAPTELKLMGKEEAGRKPLNCWPGWGWRTRRRPIRDSSPADRSRGWPSRVLLP